MTHVIAVSYGLTESEGRIKSRKMERAGLSKQSSNYRESWEGVPKSPCRDFWWL